MINRLVGIGDSMSQRTVRYFMDGNKWCAVYEDFQDLVISPAGFGDTQEEARAELEAVAKRERAKTTSPKRKT
jgi:hypothetical protein